MTLAVLLIIFNRPRTTSLVMEAIRCARPERFYIAADGPRDHNGERDKNDIRMCAEALSIATVIDWPCHTEMLVREDNLGCRFGVVTAINWFFENEPEGVILEDDCVPSPSFFPYCREMLKRFRYDKRIMSVAGDNFQADMSWCRHSYYFSKWFHSWGWASWARAWRMYDHDLRLYGEWTERDWYKEISRLPGFANYWRRHFEPMGLSKDTWDYLWLATCWANSGLTITPRVNLVSNIGFGADSTHCPSPTHRTSNLPRSDLVFPLSHPGVVIANSDADDHVSRFVFGIDA